MIHSLQISFTFELYVSLKLNQLLNLFNKPSFQKKKNIISYNFFFFLTEFSYIDYLV